MSLVHKFLEACKKGVLGKVKKFLVQDPHIQTQLIEASKKGDLEEVKKLVEQGVDMHAHDDLAFRWAALGGHLEIVKYFVDKGADIRVRDDLALQWAAAEGHLEVVDFLKAVIQKRKRRNTIECL